MMSAIEQLADDLYASMCEAGIDNKATRAYREAIQPVRVTKWKHPDMPSLTLKGSREQTFEEAVGYFGEESDHIIQGEEHDMLAWKFNDLEEWCP